MVGNRVSPLFGQARSRTGPQSDRPAVGQARAAGTLPALVVGFKGSPLLLCRSRQVSKLDDIQPTFSKPN